jgi:hypothetical protein
MATTTTNDLTENPKRSEGGTTTTAATPAEAATAALPLGPTGGGSGGDGDDGGGSHPAALATDATAATHERAAAKDADAEGGEEEDTTTLMTNSMTASTEEDETATAADRGRSPPSSGRKQQLQQQEQEHPNACTGREDGMLASPSPSPGAMLPPSPTEFFSEARHPERVLTEELMEGQGAAATAKMWLGAGAGTASSGDVNSANEEASLLDTPSGGGGTSPPVTLQDQPLSGEDDDEEGDHREIKPQDQPILEDPEDEHPSEFGDPPTMQEASTGERDAPGSTGPSPLSSAVSSKSMDDVNANKEKETMQLSLASGAGEVVVVAPETSADVQEKEHNGVVTPTLFDAASPEDRCGVNGSSDEEIKTEVKLASATGEVMVVAPFLVSAIDQRKVDAVLEQPPQQQASEPGAIDVLTTEGKRTGQEYAKFSDKRIVVDRGIASEAMPEQMAEWDDAAPPCDGEDPGDSPRADSNASSNWKARGSRTGKGRNSFERPEGCPPNSVANHINDEANNMGSREGGRKPMHVGAYAIRPPGQNRDGRQYGDLNTSGSGTPGGVYSERSTRSLKSANSAVTTGSKPLTNLGGPVPDDGMTTNGLAVAVPIDEERHDLENQRMSKLNNMPHATKKDPTDKPHILQSRKVQLGIAAAVAIIVAILLAILLTGGGTGGPADGTTSAPTLAPTSQREGEFFAFFASKVDNSTDLYDTESSAFLAADWIINEDSEQLALDSPRLLQRFALAEFYFATSENGDKPWKLCNPQFLEVEDDVCPTNPWLGDEDECSWNGVFCNASGEVMRLILRKFWFKGEAWTDGCWTRLTLLFAPIDFCSNRWIGWEATRQSWVIVQHDGT